MDRIKTPGIEKVSERRKSPTYGKESSQKIAELHKDITARERILAGITHDARNAIFIALSGASVLNFEQDKDATKIVSSLIEKMKKIKNNTEEIFLIEKDRIEISDTIYVGLLPKMLGSRYRALKLIANSALPSIIEGLKDFIDLAESNSIETIKDPDGYLSTVIVAANDAKSLFEDALKKQNDINVAEQESVEKDLLIVDVKEVLSGLKPFLDLVRKESEVKVEISLPEEKVATLISRKTLRRIIYNLVANAKDASVNSRPEDKLVKVSVEIYNTPGSNEQFVLLKVIDRGSGMDDDTKIKIFKPDPNKPFSTKENGSGYGLPNIREYLDKNNGRIEVESEPGKGTTFSVYLPLERRT